MTDSQCPKKAGVDATRVSVKLWKGQDEWRANDAFGWEHSIDEFENFGKDSDNKVTWQTEMERTLGMNENVEHGDV